MLSPTDLLTRGFKSLRPSKISGFSFFLHHHVESVTVKYFVNLYRNRDSKVVKNATSLFALVSRLSQASQKSKYKKDNISQEPLGITNSNFDQKLYVLKVFYRGEMEGLFFSAEEFLTKQILKNTLK